MRLIAKRANQASTKVVEGLRAVRPAHQELTELLRRARPSSQLASHARAENTSLFRLLYCTELSQIKYVACLPGSITKHFNVPNVRSASINLWLV